MTSPVFNRQAANDFRPVPDTIQIMRNAFEPDQLRSLVSCLEADGHLYELFDGYQAIPTALAHPRSKLLFLRAGDGEIPCLIDSIRSNPQRAFDIPILVSLKQSPALPQKKHFMAEIDDFFLEPLNLHEVSIRVDRLARRFADKKSEVEQLQQSLVSVFGIKQFIGTAPSFVETIKRLPRVASSDATVLITGETGTGKEMCARAIHYLSARSNRTFIPVNCGSIPNELFENEMFGHESGAYTDARQAKRGLIAEAEGGTLFLDEVDSLSASAQVKLLRFLQDQQYKPLGASKYRQANVRIIAATNRNLQASIKEGSFREDLYYRLMIVSLCLPPLRERRSDISLLASHFLKIATLEYNSPVVSFSPGAIQKLLVYGWPGNVRELENVVRQSVVLADEPTIRAHNIQLSSNVRDFEPPSREPLKIAKARIVESFEREYLKEIIISCEGNISKAARAAKKNRRAFFALLKKYDLTSSKALSSEEE